MLTPATCLKPHHDTATAPPRSSWLAAKIALTALVSALVVASASPAYADPTNDPAPPPGIPPRDNLVLVPPDDSPLAANPYPKDSLVLTSYTRVNPADYFIPGLYGVYFLSPTGLNCGIWLRGSFGCAGNLPGNPNDHIGWFNGDRWVHTDWATGTGFPHAQATQVLPPRSYVNWNETTCVTTGDSSTYCYRGMFRFMITPTATYLNGG
jgi:hypothetical protein